MTTIHLFLFFLLSTLLVLLSAVSAQSDHSACLLANLRDANFPTTKDGRTYHLEIKRGEGTYFFCIPFNALANLTIIVLFDFCLLFNIVSNRILTVGDLERAQHYADLYLDKPLQVHILSKRGFLTITGFYKGVQVSIIGTGMGTPMIDFTIREARAMIPSCTTVAMVRVGTCGSPSVNVELGDVVVAANSTFLRRNPDAYHDDQVQQALQIMKMQQQQHGQLEQRASLANSNNNPYYTITKPVNADAVLTYNLFKNLRADLNETKVVKFGLDVTADSFYSSQGRILNDFEDHNEDLIRNMVEPMNALSLQMETFHLFDLARSSTVHSRIVAAAGCLVIAQRHTDEFIDDELKHKRELAIGKSALEALIEMQL